MKPKSRKKQIVYKVLSHDGFGNRLESWTPPVGCRQKYSKNLVNKPKIKGSGMFVFKSLHSASRFAGRNKYACIYKCEATNVRSIRIRVDVGENSARVMEFWKLFRRAKTLREWPACKAKFWAVSALKGSAICSTLKLIKRVL